MSSGEPRVLIVGAGGIGGVLGYSLSASGVRPTVLTSNERVAETIRRRGFRLAGDGGARSFSPEAVLTEAPPPATFDWVLLAVQPPQVVAAARAALPALSARGQLVCLQNGLCEERVAALSGSARVVGAVVAWGASMVEPGVYERTSEGGFSLGVLSGGDSSRLAELSRLLAGVGKVTITDNLLGVRWSKLAINCAVSTLGTLGGARLGKLLKLRFVRRLALEIVTEAVLVARAEGVRLEKVAGTVDLDWLSLERAERRAPSVALLTKHALMLAVGARYRRMRSSMLGALERGREPAVDFLNGEVVGRAAGHALTVPVNARARDMVWAVARGERSSSPGLLRELYEATRAATARAPG